MNLFLYIIWSTANYKKDEILEDIRKSFTIHKIMEIEWTKERFSENLSRFYGQKLPQNSFKEKACGTEPFTLVVFEDENPVYELRKTSRGENELVNIHTFDKKTLYRQWTTGNERKVHSKIHGTNSQEETEHDLTLLTGFAPEDFIQREAFLPEKLKQDIIGADGWESLERLFYVLNHTCKYVVLRNFEGLPESFHVGEHADIDLLAEQYEDVRRICMGREVFRQKNRVQCTVLVEKVPTQFDFRYIGDGYYDKSWEQSILDRRISKNGIFIPDTEQYKYMILYHVLMHKLAVADDYKVRLDSMFGYGMWNEEVLIQYMNENKYSFTEPLDLSVYFNNEIAKTRISWPRNLKMFKIAVKKTLRKMIGGRK